MRFLSAIIRQQKNFLSFLLLIVAVISLCGASVLPDRASFSGEWKLNDKKSDLGQFGARTAAHNYIIQQTADSLALDETVPSPQGGEVNRKEKLSFDGKEIENVLSPQATKKSSAKWSDDGQSLTVNSVILFTRDGDQIEIKVTEVWTLQNNGQTLSIQSNSSSSFGENSMKLVYDKTK